MIISLAVVHIKVKNWRSYMNYSQTPEIVYEDRDIIVCLKPAGTPTQSRQIGVPDMVSILKNHLADQERSKGRKTSEKKASPTPYLAVVHRLDQPVEGLLVFAKTPASARELNRQLNTSAFGKYYAAFVEGIPQPEEGCLENFLVKDGRSNTSRICPENTPSARHAKLHYHVTDILDGNAFVKIRLDTGRHHQIRVQMSHFGHPLAGDRKYGSTLHAPQLCLCAYRLSFLHPADHHPMEFTVTPSFCKISKVPDDSSRVPK